MVNGVARLVKMCRNRSGLDELMVILDGRSSPKRSCSWRFVSPMYCFVHFLHSIS